MKLDPVSRRLLRRAGAVSAEQGRGPVVLMYHGLHADRAESTNKWSLSAGRFREQMELLREEGWNTLRVCDLETRGDLPPRAVAVTFDDGYRDNLEYGFPVLKELGLTATWFVVTGDLGRRSSWRDPGAEPRLMLSGGELREMAEEGMEIGAHTRSHVDLTALAEADLGGEVAGSREDLASVLGSEVRSFAYPYGRFSADVVGAVAGAGYSVACTSVPGWVGTDRDPYRIRRVAVFSYDTLSSFARKIAYADTAVTWRSLFGRVVAAARRRVTQR